MGGSQSVTELAKEQSVHVVVIGGGYGGTACALALKKHGIPFTLIEPKEYFHHNVGALRAAVDKGELFGNLSICLSITQTCLSCFLIHEIHKSLPKSK